MNNRPNILNALMQPGTRMPDMERWLHQDVWSHERFNTMTPEDYLKDGEGIVFDVEECIMTAAPRLYDELTTMSLRTRSIDSLISDDERIAFVILDGASIRELPLFERLAVDTHFEILESTYGIASLPSDTLAFVEQRIANKAVSPSQLSMRKDLRDRGWSVWYYDAPTRHFELPSDAHLLLWSVFPDATYVNFEARFATHFSEMIQLYEGVWKNIVQAIPKGYKIIVTSDHGYAYFGSGLDSKQQGDGPRILEQGRYKVFADGEVLPDPTTDLHIIPEKRLAMLKGRVKNRPQGPMGNRAYRHGGMSLMEMLTPYLVLRKM